ncbi:serine carboxypeptidase S28-domain-containing protein [Phyllosticta citrichinensis]
MAQALKDVEYFATRFSRPKFPKVDLTPESTPWIFVGASYPGNRAAWLRQYYPHVIFAAYASSAPLQMAYRPGVYFDQIYRGMNAYGFGNCSKDMHTAILHIDKLLEDPETAATVKLMFLGPTRQTMRNEDFAAYLTRIFDKFQNYGMEKGLREFCDYMETEYTANPPLAGAQGWAPRYGPEYVVWKWASGLSKMNTPGVYNPSGISWNWQVCTEFQSGLVTANIGPMQLVSSFLRPQDRPSYCEASKAYEVSTHETNQRYGGWDIRPSRTFWAGGEFDPWAPWTLFSNESAAPHPKVTSEIPECNGTRKDEIFGRVLRNSVHALDFDVSPDAAVTRKLFTDALTKWLKCFRTTKRYPKQEHGDSTWEGRPGV